MANKIFTIQTNTREIDQNDEIYLDISQIPKYVDGKKKIARNVNIRAVQNSIDNIFTFIPGEKILDPEFGNKVRRYLYDGITQFNEEQIVAEIRRCLVQYEPRVQLKKVVNVSDVHDTENNTIALNIYYTIDGIEDRVYNKQYEFNLVV